MCILSIGFSEFKKDIIKRFNCKQLHSNENAYNHITNMQHFLHITYKSRQNEF